MMLCCHGLDLFDEFPELEFFGDDIRTTKPHKIIANELFKRRVFLCVADGRETRYAEPAHSDS